MSKATYKSSGVDIGKANAFVRSIKSVVKGTFRPGVIQRDGAFGALFQVPKGYKDPVMVSSTDGVGTKLLIAQKLGIHNTVGIDLVAMNVNDILCTGARPLFFLDYIACGKLDPRVLKDVVSGIAKGCRQSGCSLIGGETAEMPGMYKPNEYDLAGFTVGVVEKSRIIDGASIREGDRLIGLPSSGFHSNGYSLVRKVFSGKRQKELAREILRPTRIYAREILEVVGKHHVKGIAHITGGAFYDKLTKVLPKGTCFSVDDTSWPVPKVFQILQKEGKIEISEMFRTFNMGIGMVLVVPAGDAAGVQKTLGRIKCRSYEIGEVIKDSRKKIKFSSFHG